MINKNEPEWVYKYNTVDDITKETSKLRKKYTQLSDKINLLDQRLREICKHPLTKTVTDYIPGGYYDKAQYITAKVCITCGTEVDRKVEEGSYG